MTKRFEISLWPLGLIIYRREGGSKWGRTRGPVVVVPHDSPPHQKAHELRHVTQWWMITIISAGILAAIASQLAAVSFWICALSIGVMGIASLVSKSVRFWLEADAYAVSTRISPLEIDRFAKALSQSYGTGKTQAEAKAAILSRL